MSLFARRGSLSVLTVAVMAMAISSVSAQNSSEKMKVISCHSSLNVITGLRVFGFQLDAIPTIDSYALLMDEMPRVDGAISYCFRAKVLYFRTETVVFTYDQKHNEHRFGI